MAITIEQINGLQIADDLKSELVSLFGEVNTKQTEVDSLRSKLPKDSQKIVEGVDYDAWQAATKELADLKKSIQDKLDKQGGKKGRAFLAAFSPFFGDDEVETEA